MSGWGLVKVKVVDKAVTFGDSVAAGPTDVLPGDHVRDSGNQVAVSEVVVNTAVKVNYTGYFTRYPGPFLQVPRGSVERVLVVTETTIAFESFIKNLGPGGNTVIFRRTECGEAMVECNA